MIRELFFACAAMLLIWWSRAFAEATITVNLNNKVSGVCTCCGGTPPCCCLPGSFTVTLTLTKVGGSAPDILGGTYLLTAGGGQCGGAIGPTCLYCYGYLGLNEAETCALSLMTRCFYPTAGSGCGNLLLRVFPAFGNAGCFAPIGGVAVEQLPDTSPSCTCSPLYAKYTFTITGQATAGACCGYGSGDSATYIAELTI